MGRYYDEDTEIASTRTITYAVARKARPAQGILPGDLVARTTGFSYEVGGARTRYAKPVYRLVGRGPNHPASLVGLGWDTKRRPMKFALPPEAVAFAALRARYNAVVEFNRKGGADVAAAEANLVVAREVDADVVAFINGIADAKERESVSSWLTSYRTYTAGALVNGAEVAITNTKTVANHIRRQAEWKASGGEWKAEGERIVFDGQTYVLGKAWSKFVPTSPMEYGDQLVDGDVVTGRFLLNPETGLPAMRWTRTLAYPAKVSPSTPAPSVVSSVVAA